jgi:hypothetical protein
MIFRGWRVAPTHDIGSATFPPLMGLEAGRFDGLVPDPVAGLFPLPHNAAQSMFRHGRVKPPLPKSMVKR